MEEELSVYDDDVWEDAAKVKIGNADLQWRLIIFRHLLKEKMNTLHSFAGRYITKATKALLIQQKLKRYWGLKVKQIMLLC